MDFGLFNTWNSMYEGGKVPWDADYRGGRLLEKGVLPTNLLDIADAVPTKMLVE